MQLFTVQLDVYSVIGHFCISLDISIRIIRACNVASSIKVQWPSQKVAVQPSFNDQQQFCGDPNKISRGEKFTGIHLWLGKLMKKTTPCFG